MRPSLDAEGQEFHGFLITKYLPLKELQSTLIELVHEASGARVIHIANDDKENLFSLSFQTLPDSSNGVAHILEHTVLCGSKKFPIKDPFFSMTRRSLNTYMNALTGQDFTCYPASSQVEKDFYNLLEVYLDAVFHPELKYLSFLQEGHRLAFSEAGNPESPLQFQGVVYNEMKGAMVGSEGRLWYHLFRLLTPDLPYAHNSGGDPKEIPKLSYDELVEFHRAFYHPSRCLFFFYGNIPLQQHLNFILEKVLRTSAKLPLLEPLPAQRRFSSHLTAVESYPIEEKENPAKKTIVAIGILTASISEQTDLLALNLIDSLLTDTDISPLKLALLKSGLCTNIESSIDLEMSESPWVLLCKGCEPSDAEKILKLTRKVFENLCQKGFDPEEIEASLHQLEFQRKEIGGEGVPFGLTLFFRAVLAKQHGADPESSLLIHSLFEDLRQRLKDPSYLTSILRRFLLDNSHMVLLTLKPDPTLQAQEEAAEKQELAHIQKHLTKEQIKVLLKEEKELEEFQAKAEHQSLDCLPKVSLKDVPPHAKDYALKDLHHTCFTNGITYADLFFDLPPVSDMPLLSLLARFVTEVGCKGRSYTEMLKLQQASVGDFTASISLFPQANPSHCRPAFCLRGKALDQHAHILFSLMQDYSTGANLLDAPRIEELLKQQWTHLQNRLPKNAMSYAVQRALSALSTTAAIQEQWQGLPFFEAVQRFAKNPEELPKALQKLYDGLLGASPALVIASQEDKPPVLTFPERHHPSWHSDLRPNSLKTLGKIISAPVAFSALAYPSVSFEHPDSAALMVASDLLENVVLHNEIREKGGAYGAGASYLPALGHFYFSSYRDPHIARTYTAFQKAIAHIASGKFTTQELEEAKLGILQVLDAPLPPGQRANAAYGWQRSGRSYELRDHYRSAIINASSEDVVRAVGTHLANAKEKSVFVTFAGEELLKKEAKKLPFELNIESF